MPSVQFPLGSMVANLNSTLKGAAKGLNAAGVSTVSGCWRWNSLFNMAIWSKICADEMLPALPLCITWNTTGMI